MRFVPLVLLMALLGCAEETSAPPSEPPPSVPCADEEIGLPDGSCIRPGIAPEECGEGFAHDGGDACAPLLPPEACPTGLIAVPGDTACRPVATCGRGKWGDVPIDGGTVHVDASYAGGGSDGSAARPFPTLAAAYAAAAPGALIAIAEGKYAEDVAIIGKPVRLWGVCPERVEIVGIGQASTTCPPAGVCIVSADGTEVHTLAVSGSGMGITVTDAENVVLDRLWVHDATGIGVDVESALGPATATLSDSLLEHNAVIGLFFIGTVQATVEKTLVRATQPRASDQRGGLGIDIEAACPANICSDPALRANVIVRGSLVEQNHAVGIHVSSSDATVENTVVRDTQPQAFDMTTGRGINLEPWCNSIPCDPSTRASGVVRGCMVERNHDVGIAVSASDVTLETTVIRDTAPRAFDQRTGSGFVVMGLCFNGVCDAAARGNALVRAAVVERSHGLGIGVQGADATIEDAVVRDTEFSLAADKFGYGVSVQLLCDMDGGGGCHPETRATASLTGSLVERNLGLGVLIGGSDAAVAQTVVRDTAAAGDGTLGDGIAAVLLNTLMVPASATIANTQVAHSARAGVGNFAASITLEDTAIQCAAFDLDGELTGETPFIFTDLGGNRCGCPTADRDCKLVTANLEPPGPLD
jgi:hypothetical protein